MFTRERSNKACSVSYEKAHQYMVNGYTLIYQSSKYMHIWKDNQSECQNKTLTSEAAGTHQRKSDTWPYKCWTIIQSSPPNHPEPIGCHSCQIVLHGDLAKVTSNWLRALGLSLVATKILPFSYKKNSCREPPATNLQQYIVEREKWTRRWSRRYCTRPPVHLGKVDTTNPNKENITSNTQGIDRSL